MTGRGYLGGRGEKNNRNQISLNDMHTKNYFFIMRLIFFTFYLYSWIDEMVFMVIGSLEWETKCKNGVSRPHFFSIELQDPIQPQKKPNLYILCR